MTRDPEEAEAWVKLGEENDKIVMVGHLLLYQPAIAYIKEALERGDIGKVFTLHQRRSKQGRARAVENVLWSFGVHDVAVLLYLAGQAPVGVQVSGHCGLQDGVEDDTYLHLTFPDGSMAHLHNSWLWPIVERGLMIIGDKGMLVYDEIAQNVRIVHKTIDADLQNVEKGEEIVFEGSGQPLRIELDHFVDCCSNRTQPNSCGQNGYNVVRVLKMAEDLLRRD
jgi:predicted dehydrogenase